MDLSEFSCTFSLWICIIILTLSACSPAEGQPLVIGSAQPVFAAPGADVILPCYLDPPLDVERKTVEWSKPDLKTNPSDPLSRVEYVHIYRNGDEVLDMKPPSYFRRTELFTDELKHGNISLKILNVTLADTGRYRCFIPKLESEVKASIVELIVDPNFIKPTATTLDTTHLQSPDSEDRTNNQGGGPNLSIWIPAIVLCTLLLVGVCVFIYKLQRKKKTIQRMKTSRVVKI